MRALGYFIFRDLLHDRWRSLLTVLTLAVILVSYLLLASLAQAMVSLSGRAPITNNLLVIAADTIDPQDSWLQESVLRAATDIVPDDIRIALPIIFRHLTVEGHIMQVRAVDLDQMAASKALTLIEGRWPEGPRESAASEGAARLGPWEVGSTVNIYGTDFRVTGVVRNEENAFGSLWMTYPEGERLFGTARGFQVGYLSLDPLADPEAVRSTLLADTRISADHSVYLEHAYTDSYNESSSNLVILSTLMVMVALLAVTFGIYNATSLSLAERGPEIGLLNVIGFTLGKMRLFLFMRALVLTLVAYTLGWLASLFFIDQQRLGASISLVFLSLRLTPFASLLGLVLAVGFSLLGVWLATGRLVESNPLIARE
jgi:ABC-type antimicrobial peptide transport system permease subunit